MAIPSAWLPKCNMKRIVVHWTAGTWRVTATDKEHYHFIRDGYGELFRGDHPIDDNVFTSDGDYAAHTRNCNSGSIGYSLASMAGAIEKPFNPGKFPIRKWQWLNMIPDLAQLCKAYSIPVKPETLLTHAEVQKTLGIKQNGKWDIAVLPFDRSYDTAKKVGDRMRAEVTAKL